MSRKDFELIARVLQSTKDESPAWRLTVETMAEALAATCPRYVKERFLRACGWTPISQPATECH